MPTSYRPVLPPLRRYNLPRLQHRLIRHIFHIILVSIDEASHIVIDKEKNKDSFGVIGRKVIDGHSCLASGFRIFIDNSRILLEIVRFPTFIAFRIITDFKSSTAYILVYLFPRPFLCNGQGSNIGRQTLNLKPSDRYWV